MLKISPAVQLSLGLVFLTVSILILAQGLGLTPGLDEQRLYTRQKLAENMALQTTIAVKRNDQFFIEGMFDQVVEQTPFILSIGLRKSNGSIVYQTSTHKKDWGINAKTVSTPTHVSVPIMINGSRRATLEIAYQPLTKEKSGYFGIPQFMWLVIFVCVSGFIAFWIYITRALKQLDPTSVVPARVRNALNIMAEGVMILDKRGQIVLANDSFVRKLSTHEGKLLGRKAGELGWNVESDSRGNKLPWSAAQFSGQKQVNIRLVNKDNNGKKQVFSVNSVPILDENGKSQGTISSFDDITELESKNRMMKQILKNLVENQKAIEQKNKELDILASRDPLTNCYNRRSLFNAMNAFFAKENDTARDYCVVMLDIDFFKRINDKHGHSVGDQVIRGVADRIREVIRQNDIVARFGGEEFCIVLESATPEKAFQIAETCRNVICVAPIEDVPVTVSLGVSSITYGATTPNEIIQQADKALYDSKNNGRNQTTLWSREPADKGARENASLVFLPGAKN